MTPKRSLSVAVTTALVALCLNSAAQAQTPVKIGVLLPLSGPFSPLAQSHLLGVRIAVDEINAKPSPVGPVQIVYADEQTNPATSAAEMHRLVGNGIKFVIGAPFWKSAQAISGIAHDAKALLLTTGSIDRSSELLKRYGSLWFHIGTDLAALNSATTRVEKNTGLKAASAACSWDPNPQIAEREDFAICPMSFIIRERWDKFQKTAEAVVQKERAKTDINAAAVRSYTAVKVLYEAVSEASQLDPEKVAAILRKRKFDTVFGERMFGDTQQILATQILFVNPAKKTGSAFESLRSKLRAEAKDKCDDCKKNNDCPQGAVASLAAEDDCCKKTSDCPQGMIFR